MFYLCIYIYKTFVTQCKDDYDLFTNELIDKRKLRISVVMFENLTIDDFEIPIPKDELQSYGFDCYLIDLIQGPEPVKCALCKLNNIHSIVSYYYFFFFFFFFFFFIFFFLFFIFLYKNN